MCGVGSGGGVGGAGRELRYLKKKNRPQSGAHTVLTCAMILGVRQIDYFYSSLLFLANDVGFPFTEGIQSLL